MSEQNPEELEETERQEQKANNERVERRRERRSAGARWAYVVLAMFNTLLFVLMGLFVIKYVGSNDHAWCEIIHASLPAQAPVLPQHATTTQIKQYNDYFIVVRLGHQLGCL